MTRMRIADYIAEFLADRGVKECFTVTGGGAMHLNDAFGHSERIRCTYQHHEQACAMAAEGYARLRGEPAAVCVTSGPGGTNAITGVMGAWLDSVPMIVISGQVKRETTIQAAPDLALRQLGDQEFDIVHTVANMTKYAVQVRQPQEIAWHLGKALARATTGRQGPVWIDVPLDIQGALVEIETLRQYEPEADEKAEDERTDQSVVTADLFEPACQPLEPGLLREILAQIRGAEAPLMLVGTGVQRAGAREDLEALLPLLGIPVVTAWNANDLVPYDSPWYAGMPGTVGTRPGNFALQNCDVLLSLGCRMNLRMIGYTHHDFARNAYKIAVDIDATELAKPTVKIDLPVHADVKAFLAGLMELLRREPVGAGSHEAWLGWCRDLVDRFPAAAEAGRQGESRPAGGGLDPYAFIDRLSRRLRADDCIVCSNGSACVVTFQAARLQAGQRMFTNSGCASMGYGLPAAIGAAMARDGRRVICLEGDGSLMMNLQELATVAYRHLDIRIFVLNNAGYHSIRQTQENYFAPPLVGVDEGSGVGFPSLQKIAAAFGIPYCRIAAEPAGVDVAEASEDERDTARGRVPGPDAYKAAPTEAPKEPAWDLALGEEAGPVLCEVMIDPTRPFAPKVTGRALEDGRIVSPTLDDMAPFLNREEYARIRFRK